MINKDKVKIMLKEMKAAQKRIATERDKIDNLISEWEGLKEDCEEAHWAMQEARDALSRLQ